MVLASQLGVRRGALDSKDSSRLARLLEKFGLPIRIQFDSPKVLEAIRMDKKRAGERIHFVLLREIGEAYVEEIAIEELEELIR
jgi:3-dehydroquinate synthase